MKSFSCSEIVGMLSKFGDSWFRISSFKIMGLSVGGYGFWPVTISKIMIPNPQISEGNEYIEPSRRSGDI